jgi:hypothetical protein
MNDEALLGRLVARNANAEQRRQTEATGQTDTRIVTGFAGTRLLAQPIGGGPESTLPALAHVVAAIGDEVFVQRLGRGWVVTGNLSGRIPVE